MKSIYWHKGLNKFQVVVRVRKKNIHIGYFSTLKKAEEALSLARKELSLPKSKQEVKKETLEKDSDDDSRLLGLQEKLNERGELPI